MSDDTSPADGQPDGAQPGKTSDENKRAAPPYHIHTQYVKDLSVENPKAPDCFRDPAMRQIRPLVEIDVTTQPLGKRLVEVVVQAQVTGRVGVQAETSEDGGAGESTAEGRTVYLVELSYGAVVEIGPIPKESIEPLLMVEIPRMLFPYIRNLLGRASQDMGHSLLLLPPVDFLNMYRWKQQEGRVDSTMADQVDGEDNGTKPEGTA